MEKMIEREMLYIRTVSQKKMFNSLSLDWQMPYLTHLSQRTGCSSYI